MTRTVTQSLLAAVAIPFLSPTVGSCQLPWEYYRPRSLQSVIEQQQDLVRRAFAEDPERTIFVGGSSFPSLPTVQYSDSVRPTPARRLALVGQWIESYGIIGETPETYETEILFREGDVDLWLPVQRTLVEELRSQVARGDSLMLFVVWVGALPTSADVEWVFLVYGFRAGP